MHTDRLQWPPLDVSTGGWADPLDAEPLDADPGGSAHPSPRQADLPVGRPPL